MARRSLFYFLFSKNNRPLYLDKNGFVQEGNDDLTKLDGSPAHLKTDPDGWKGTLQKYARNIKYWGVFREMTSPMNFPDDGYEILRTRYWNYGVEGIVNLGIAKLDRLNLPYLYKSWNITEINFAKYEETKTDIKVEALEGGPIKYLKANENTVYDIKIDEFDQAKSVLMDGMEFDFNRTFGIIPDQHVEGTVTYYMALTETSREGNTVDIEFQDLVQTVSSVYPNNGWVIRSGKLQTFRIHGVVTIYYDKAVTPVIRLEVNDGVTGGSTQYVLYTGPQPAGTTVTAVIDQTFDVPAKGRAHIKIFGGSPTDSTTQFTIKEGNILIDYAYRHPKTYVKGIYLYRLAERLVDKITGGRYLFKSDWLKNKRDIIITSGDALRLINGAFIKISWADFFQSLFAKAFDGESIGLAIEDNKIVIEPFSYFFRNDVVVELGEVANAKVSPAEDIMFNTIKAGGDPQDYTDVNGKYEVNQGQQWTTPMTKIIREVNFVSPIRSDSLGAELLRINYEQKLTTDTNSDNDTFMLNVEIAQQIDVVPNPAVLYYKLYRPPYSAVTGLPHWQTAYNTELSPKKGILNNGALIHSCLDFEDADVMKMSHADKNAELSTTLAGVTITQKENIQIGSMLPKIFRPDYITFTTKLPLNVSELLSANPYGKIKFTWNKRDWYAFIFDGGVNVGTNDKQEWKVLSAPENELLNFNTKK